MVATSRLPHFLDSRLTDGRLLPLRKISVRGREDPRVIVRFGFEPATFRLVFFIWILGGGVHTGSTRHCGHSWPIVPAPDDVRMEKLVE
jgi:hypothetical protein